MNNLMKCIVCQFDVYLAGLQYCGTHRSVNKLCELIRCRQSPTVKYGVGCTAHTSIVEKYRHMTYNRLATLLFRTHININGYNNDKR